MRELKVLRRREADVMSSGAASRFHELAAERGLIDVAYAVVPSPIGDLIVAGTKRGLVRISFPTETPDDVVDELSMQLSPRVLESPAQLDAIRRELDEYFEGRRQSFDLTLDLTNGVDGIEGSLEYSSDLFEPASAARMKRHFLVLLEGVDVAFSNWNRGPLRGSEANGHKADAFVLGPL